MALQAPLFPIDQPVMPEERQIGRRASIDALEERVEAVVHQWLIGARRIGKTSVAKAVLARLRAKDVVALDVDLSKLDIATPEGLAGEIARQAQAAQAGAARANRRRVGFTGRQAAGARRLGKSLEEFGFQDEGKALAAVAALLASADAGEPGLGKVLEALALHARATDRRVVILLDEVHLLAHLEGCEETAARWAREADSPIVFIIAGSEESAVRALRDAGRPLAPVGQEFHLPDIETKEWLLGLRHRFHEANITVADDQLFAIVEASDGHPRRTMLIAGYARSTAAAEPERGATKAAVDLAIRDAQKDRAWT